MSIFGSIMSKIFSHPAAAAQSGAHVSAQAAVQKPDAAAAASPQPAPAVPQSPGAPTAQGNTAPLAPGVQTAAQPAVDVEAVLAALGSENPQKLDWRRSIVDLLKLLDLDSSFDARKELARELHYTGDTGDSATMNIWLHRQVMTKLAENGGKVPDELKH
jgi:hypothetical protein